jgi:hypothetical protein
MFEDGQLPAAIEPESIHVEPAGEFSPAAVAPKRDRRRRLTSVNGNSRVGRRIRELLALFGEELGGEVRGLRLFKLRRAAELVALAETARGAALRNGTGATGELSQIEARAERACKSLGISIF